MKNRFQGDPKIYLTPDGADLNFFAGQPDMDDGFENQVILSLFTAPGWWGNALIDNIDQQYGSDFEEKSKGPITLEKLAQIEQDAKRNAEYRAFGDIKTKAVNPVSNQTNLSISIFAPGKDVDELRLTRNAQNWQNQAKGD